MALRTNETLPVMWLKIFGVKLRFIYFWSCEQSELWDDTLGFSNETYSSKETLDNGWFSKKNWYKTLSYEFLSTELIVQDTKWVLENETKNTKTKCPEQKAEDVRVWIEFLNSSAFWAWSRLMTGYFQDVIASTPSRKILINVEPTSEWVRENAPHHEAITRNEEERQPKLALVQPDKTENLTNFASLLLEF